MKQFIKVSIDLTGDFQRNAELRSYFEAHHLIIFYEINNKSDGHLLRLKTSDGLTSA